METCRRFAPLITLIVAIWLGAAGCMSNMSRWSDPGTIRCQQSRAALFDPYPDDDLGPEVVGGRPREFQRPMPGPVKDTWLREHGPMTLPVGR